MPKRWNFFHDSVYQKKKLNDKKPFEKQVVIQKEKKVWQVEDSIVIQVTGKWFQ